MPADDALRQLEARRRALLARCGAIGTAGAAVPAGWFWFLGAGVPLAYAAAGGAFVAAMATAGAYGALRTTWAVAYKEAVIGRLVAELAPTMRYEARTVFLREAAKASGFLPAGHAYTFSEDLVSGSLDGRQVAFCELRARTHDHTDHGGEARGTGGAFQGLFLRLGLDAPVRDHVVLLPARDRLGRAAQHYDAARPGCGRPVAFEDAAFTATFQAFAQDPGVARAVLRPAVRELLVRLAAGGPLFVAWRSTDLFVGIPRDKPWLEPAALLAAPSTSQIARFEADLAGVFAMLAALGPALAGLPSTDGPVAATDRPGPVGPG